MNRPELRRQVQALGLHIPETVPTGNQIRAIQYALGREVCFATDLRYDCTDWDCPWRSECMQLTAVWLR